MSIQDKIADLPEYPKDCDTSSPEAIYAHWEDNFHAALARLALAREWIALNTIKSVERDALLAALEPPCS